MKGKKRKSKKVTVELPIAAAETEIPTATESSAAKRTFAISTEIINDQMWLRLGIAITAIAAFLRFFWLELKPFHHDEGVNGFFLRTLFLDGVYKYDPANYHGPTLYYISLVFAKLFGLNTIPVRVSMAIFGVLMVALALFLKRYIGKAGSLIAALFLAISPGMVFISRYFIHEILFVFLSLAIVVAVVFFVEKRKAGPFAVGWTALLLFVCFLPPAITLSAFLGGENTIVVWALRLTFLAVEALLAYFVLRLLLTWDNGRPVYVLLASASAALFFATKETAFITLGTMLIACATVWIWRKVWAESSIKSMQTRMIIAVHAVLIAAAVYYRDPFIDGAKWINMNFIANPYRPPEYFVFFAVIFLIGAAIAAWGIFVFDGRSASETELTEPVDITWQNFRQGLGSRNTMILICATAAIAFIYVNILFFSSFFTYSEGIRKAVEAYAIWTKTGNKDHTQNGAFAYLKWGMKLEAPIIVISALGALIAMIKGKHRFAMFTALWAFGLAVAYSIIPYKTPWLALSYFLPMCIIAGYGLNELLDAKNIRLKIGAVALLISGVSVLVYQTYQLNFVRYDDDDMSYVYAHTKREFLDLMREIDHYAEKSGKGNDAQIEIVTPDYWPMTWYVKDYGKAYFQGHLVDATTAEMIVAKKKDQDKDVVQKYAGHYKFVGVYPLRPGVDLMLLVRNDLADANARELSKILETKPN